MRIPHKQPVPWSELLKPPELHEGPTGVESTRHWIETLKAMNSFDDACVRAVTEKLGSNHHFSVRRAAVEYLLHGLRIPPNHHQPLEDEEESIELVKSVKGQKEQASIERVKSIRRAALDLHAKAQDQGEDNIILKSHLSMNLTMWIDNNADSWRISYSR